MTQKLRSFLLFFLLPTAAAVGACDCAGNTPNPPITTDCDGTNDGMECDTGICCGGSCEDNEATCPVGFECDGAPMCDDGAMVCDCVPLPPLQRGRMADDLDSTVLMDGTFVMAGYSPGNPEELGPGLFGDLVVGTYDGAGAVDWEIVDGVPAGADVEGAPDGWRGGIDEPGDDVGRYPSIEAIGNDLVVAYADRTNGSLKAAARVDGTWSVHEVDAGAGAIVAWTSMALDGTGIPIVAYLVMQTQDPGMSQTHPQSSLRIARPSASLPSGGSWSWSTYELLSAPMGCHDGLCADGYTCITEGTCVVEDGTGDCDPECGSEVCFNGACYQKKRATDHYMANGLFIDVERTSTGFGLVYYDRNTGNLYGRQCNVAPCDSADDWAAAIVIDGFDGARGDAGDCGIGASLFVDSGNVWHVTYVDGTAEELRYARLPNGASPTYELVDDGSAGLTGLDRPQISFVGDDSAVVGADVAGGVEVRVAYADVTLHTTVLATRAPGGGWSYAELAPSDGEASFSVTQSAAGGEQTYVGSMWYHVASASEGGVFASDTDVFPNPAPVTGDGGI